VGEHGVCVAVTEQVGGRHTPVVCTAPKTQGIPNGMVYISYVVLSPLLYGQHRYPSSSAGQLSSCTDVIHQANCCCAITGLGTCLHWCRRHRGCNACVKAGLMPSTTSLDPYPLSQLRDTHNVADTHKPIMPLHYCGHNTGHTWLCASASHQSLSSMFYLMRVPLPVYCPLLPLNASGC
jgi:hypothetical protein